MAAINSVMAEYGIHPYDVEHVSKRLYKVSDGRQVYALKQSRLTEDTVPAWENIFHQAYASHLPTILPVYLTKQSNLYVRMDDTYYYLMPWIPEHQPSHEMAVTNAYEAIGEIHAKTKQSTSIDTDSIISHFNEYRQNNAERQNVLLDYVEMFERNRYMSPFELQVCTHYHVLVKVLTELDHHTARFMDELENEQQWYYSLCHGHLTLSHFLHHRHTYLINWEQATYHHPVLDLSMLLHEQARHYDQSQAQLVKLFSVYNRQNPLNISERHLLTIYLLDPSYYISLIRNYIENPGHKTMIKQTQKLQRVFRQLELGLKWSELEEYDDDSNRTSDNTSEA